jgi:hypothetical protein
MINGITSNSSHILAYSNGSSSITSGSLRMQDGRLEAYTGYSWTPVEYENGIVGLTSTAEQAIDWAYKKMLEEQEEQALVAKYPSFDSAKGQYEMIKQICQAEEELDKRQGT